MSTPTASTLPAAAHATASPDLLNKALAQGRGDANVSGCTTTWRLIHAWALLGSWLQTGETQGFLCPAHRSSQQLSSQCDRAPILPC
jgi:hypothetical protein